MSELPERPIPVMNGGPGCDIWQENPTARESARDGWAMSYSNLFRYACRRCLPVIAS